jgi:membrane protein
MRSGVDFLVYVMRRFLADSCLPRAAGLSYTALLALVPLVAISFAIFAAFPAFQNMKGVLQTFIFENLVPEIGSVVYEYIEQFTQKTGQLTAFGVVFLGFTSIMLLSSINSTFNTIWRAREIRPLVSRLMVYWAVLTLSPILFGTSISLSGYLFAMAQASGVEQFTGPLSRLAGLLPLLLQVAGFSILFLVMPSFPVRRRDALSGGIAAGLLFEILKKGFGLYIQSAPTYETLYGALAVVPILLVWMYLAWIVVLLGAEFTAALPEWRAGARTVRRASLPAARLTTAALAILHALVRASRNGRALNARRLARAVREAPETMIEVTEKLEAKRYITKGERGHWLLARDLDAATLADLQRDLGLAIEAGNIEAVCRTSWGERYADIVARLRESEAGITDIALKDLLSPRGEAEVVDFPDPAEDGEDVEEEVTDRKTRLLALLGLTTIGTS